MYANKEEVKTQNILSLREASIFDDPFVEVLYYDLYYSWLDKFKLPPMAKLCPNIIK
jgi:hypothetical protein